MARESAIEQVARVLYQWPNKDLGRHQSLAEVCKIAPKTIVTLQRRFMDTHEDWIYEIKLAHLREQLIVGTDQLERGEGIAIESLTSLCVVTVWQSQLTCTINSICSN